ncbi:uncharacterized protein LOC114946024 [Nylanderia fulva]|nr:uncharacterized protein LOC114935704 [Nylanderia fulva]XP_029178238.1 uncharacterized protein LOC114946024 [Nylanderia fulva]
MVSQFPLDYMHLICLGVVKKILQTFTHGSHKQKFSAKMIKEISANLKTIAKWIPSEFARKTRELENLDRWKATELRLFLLYVGPVALQNYLPKKYLIHFISLHCAIRILCHETDCKRNNKYAKDLLNYFVEKCIELFGTNFLIYNTHNLIHLADDVLKFGHLDSFSAFSFESYLYNIKKKLKKAEKPLQQLHNRIVEHVACNLKKKIIFFEKPKVMCKNNKKSEELGIASYNTIHYNKFTLSTINKADQFCYLQDDTIVRVKNICLNNDNPILIGESLINPIGFPNYPIDSKEFDIVIGNQWSHSTNFDANNVTRKAVCIPYKKSYCFLPLLHSYN